MTRLLDGRHHLERLAMEQAGAVDYLITAPSLREVAANIRREGLPAMGFVFP
ncbi:hypothetical protein ACIBKY_23755 [Nonomuraea sp. NPDC050394]|uniref:hypothetical protein n=1 Tax=Nonomuraea sp. NPDC050394 TaxID=3364363 RepID=UPI0037963EB5